MLIEAIAFLSLFYTVASLSISIDGVNGRNNYTCLNQSNFQACQSLEYVSSHLKDLPTGAITLVITSDSLTVSKTVSFSGINGLTISGQGIGKTRITCSSIKKEVGLVFNNCTQLALGNFSIDNCGCRLNVTLISVAASIGIKNSTNVTVSFLMITKSRGRAMIMNDIMSYGTVSHCVILKNGSPRNETDIHGGLFMRLSENVSNAVITISNCTFSENYITKVNVHDKWKNHDVHGGGMSLFLWKTFNNRINITGTNFTYNEAPMAAGLKINVTKGNGNIIQVIHCNFSNNNASIGGGGSDVGLSDMIEDESRIYSSMKNIENKNRIFLNQSVFYNNSALFGGGLAMYASSSKSNFINTVIVDNCTFLNNKAFGGSAVNVNRDVKQINGLKHFGSTFHFISCEFSCNHAGREPISVATAADISQTGTLFTSLVPVIFSGNNTFYHNNGTAVYSSDGVLNFTKSSFTNFSNNVGEKGGAILLVGTAYLNIQPNSSLHFESNKASIGGAICSVQLETKYFGYTELCFIKSERPETIAFSFQDNHATSGIANDIFVANVRECVYRCSVNSSLVFTEQCIGNMSFSNNQSSIASSTETITVDKAVEPFPGIPYKLNVTQKDVFNNDVSQLFPLTVGFMYACKISIDPGFIILTDNNIKLYGQPGSSGKLVLQGYTNTNVQVSTNVNLSYCSPGYVLNNDTCVCSAADDFTRLEGISCPNGSAVLQGATWAGYLRKFPHELMTANCKVGLCNRKRETVLTKKLENVCHDSREGVLCSQCKPNYTVYYHSNSYLCKEISNCKHGILLYVVSELLPITIIFLVILILNINITTGAVNTFIFCAQVLSSLFIDAFEVVKTDNNALRNIFSLYRLGSGFLNLNIFVFDHFSFCLIKDAKILDLFLVKYFSVIYAFSLIVLTVIIMRLNSLYSCIKLCHKCGRRNIRTSIINGLIAFLILCYFQCVRITFNILVPSSIIRSGGKVVSVRLLFDGDIEYMSYHHLPYAISAILCLLIVILPPPIVLTLEPLLIRFSGILKFRRNSFTYCLHRFRMKLKPFLDSFQGCFKDNCRCFAGLFFFYRVIVLAPSVYSSSIVFSYMQATIILLCICILHGLVRPYQKKWHNYVDLLLLANITAVTMLTTIDVFIELSSTNYISKKAILISQVILVSLSLIYVCLYFIYYLLKRFNVLHKFQQMSFTMLPVTSTKADPSTASLIDDDSLPARLLYEESVSTQYGSNATN